MAIVLAAATGCDAANYVEGVTTWRSQDDAYGVTYVTPPWNVTQDDGLTLRLEIPAEIFGLQVSGSPPTHAFALGPATRDHTIADLLPSTAQGLFGSTGLGLATDGLGTDGLGTDGLGTDGLGTDATTADLPGLLDVDLRSPKDVALAELDLLVTTQAAELVQELRKTDAAGTPWRYDVVIPPGLYVRGLYYDGGERTIRAAFGSLFAPSDGDLDEMAATIELRGTP
ncbi:MAG: hypothetical protein K1X88_06665 [Nannocystaceae bacterium]|nr:hypothetical protein [Nannocystaceae bacterium]